MSLVTTSIPNLVNGVSQQPQSLRLASQGELQENGLSSISQGLRKRPAFRHIGKILDTGIGDGYVHVINRDKQERYVVTIYNENVRVFDIQGNEIPVRKPDGTTYLASSSPSEDFDTITVADYTFVVNKTITARRGSKESPTRPKETIVWFKQGDYGSTFTVNVGENSYSYKTPDGSDPSHADDIATDFIAESIAGDMSGLENEGVEVSTRGSQIIIRQPETDYAVTTEDSLGNTAIVTIGPEIQRFSELPADAPDGFEVEVTGDQSSQFDNYYVKFSNGVWKETIRQGQNTELDKSTLPHALIREADGTFTFRGIDWDGRKVGDLESNPFPSFIDSTISGVFFHRNRFGVISGENVIMSKAGDFFNFFRGTAIQVLDDDPIDVGVSHVKVSILRHAIPFNETLLLFSDQTQFQLGRDSVLTPDTVSINQTTEYETSLQAKPGAAGRFVYFMVNRGGYSGVREYYVDRSTEVQQASDVTGHVPEYIPKNVFKITASSNEDVLVLLTKDEPHAAYIYRYYWSGEEKIQASWSRWTIPEGDRILNAEFIESDLYATIERDDGVYLEVCSFEPGYTEGGMPSAVHLDRLIDQSQVNAMTFDGDDTHLTLPYKVDGDQNLQLVISDGGTIRRGVIINPEVDNTGKNTVATVRNLDLSDGFFFIGVAYTFRYRFSQLSLRENSSGGGTSTVNSGRTQVRKMNLQYSDAGYFRIEVTPFRRETYEYVFSGRKLGSARNLIGDISIDSGTFQFPIMARNTEVTIEIVNDSYLPASFLSSEWEAYYSTRSKRL